MNDDIVLLTQFLERYDRVAARTLAERSERVPAFMRPHFAALTPIAVNRTSRVISELNRRAADPRFDSLLEEHGLTGAELNAKLALFDVSFEEFASRGSSHPTDEDFWRKLKRALERGGLVLESLGALIGAAGAIDEIRLVILNAIEHVERRNEEVEREPWWPGRRLFARIRQALASLWRRVAGRQPTPR